MTLILGQVNCAYAAPLQLAVAQEAQERAGTRFGVSGGENMPLKDLIQLRQNHIMRMMERIRESQAMAPADLASSQKLADQLLKGLQEIRLNGLGDSGQKPADESSEEPRIDFDYHSGFFVLYDDEGVAFVLYDYSIDAFSRPEDDEEEHAEATLQGKTGELEDLLRSMVSADTTLHLQVAPGGAPVVPWVHYVAAGEIAESVSTDRSLEQAARIAVAGHHEMHRDAFRRTRKGRKEPDGETILAAAGSRVSPLSSPRSLQIPEIPEKQSSRKQEIIGLFTGAAGSAPGEQVFFAFTTIVFFTEPGLSMPLGRSLDAAGDAKTIRV
ncbi:MAG: hypothetical protein JW937_06185 [Candidatus Omnitrophica bacterium]|nr:hypothetical protein [Candidatus Omnitrophota bacterium]